NSSAQTGRLAEERERGASDRRAPREGTRPRTCEAARMWRSSRDRSSRLPLQEAAHLQGDIREGSRGAGRTRDPHAPARLCAAGGRHDSKRFTKKPLRAISFHRGTHFSARDEPDPRVFVRPRKADETHQDTLVGVAQAVDFTELPPGFESGIPR